MTRKTSQLSNVANTDAPRIPSWASCELVALERDVGDEQRDGEPDAGDGRRADERRPGDRERQPSEPASSGQPGRAADADELADDEAADDAERDAGGQPAVDRLATERDAGVGEREQRDDHVARPRVPDRPGAVRSATRRGARSRWRSGRTPVSAARGRSATASRPARAPRASAGTPSRASRPRRRRSSGGCPTRATRPRTRARRRSRPCRSGRRLVA